MIATNLKIVIKNNANIYLPSVVEDPAFEKGFDQFIKGIVFSLNHARVIQVNSMYFLKANPEQQDAFNDAADDLKEY